MENTKFASDKQELRRQLDETKRSKATSEDNFEYRAQAAERQLFEVRTAMVKPTRS